MTDKKIEFPDKKSQLNASWVQIQRSSLRELEVLTSTNPSAMRLLLVLIRHMDGQNAVIMSRETMGKLMGTSARTAIRALNFLKEGKWIETIRIGNITAVVINARVAWTQHSKLRSAAIFQATIVAAVDEQETAILNQAPLRKIPVLIPPELAVIADEGDVCSDEQGEE